MTRFARARGSKASNEKAPEDSTPWEVMKEQLIKAKQENDEAKKRHEAEQQRIENYENFLKEQKVQKRKAEWCEFPNSYVPKKEKQPDSKKHNKSKKNKDHKSEVETSTEDKAPKVKISKQNAESNSTEQSSEGMPRKKKNKKQKNDEKYMVGGTNLHTNSNAQSNSTGQYGECGPQKNKKNKKQFNENFDTVNDGHPPTNTDYNKQNENSSNTSGSNNQPMKKQKNKKVKDGKPQRRKPVDDKSFQLIINGKEVELVRYDGFPVMRRDADRLEQLKNDMIKKGIPKSEVQRTMKLERRRAEKALARMKKDVCYNCRKGGHNLSDCPDLKSKIPGVDAAEGVCFKCGSTEHRQFECKVQRDKEFRFATCFICKEPGHIARQCPDNPKGLYPNGGGCKLCGDVTHLRKDCPTVQDKREETSFKLQTIDGAVNIEDIDQQIKNNTSTETSKKPKKIKF